jgi:hypothetical protein
MVLLVFIITFEVLPNKRSQVLCHLVTVQHPSILDISVDLDPHLLNDMPQPISHLSIPLTLTPLAQLVPQSVVILGCPLVVLVILEHFRGEVFVLD